MTEFAERVALAQARTAPTEQDLDRWLNRAERDCVAEIDDARARYKLTRDRALESLTRAREEIAAIRTPVAESPGRMTAGTLGIMVAEEYGES
jgi:hypothetical protein